MEGLKILENKKLPEGEFDFALLAVSGGGIISAVLYGKKKKQEF